MSNGDCPLERSKKGLILADTKFIKKFAGVKFRMITFIKRRGILFGIGSINTLVVFHELFNVG